MPFEQAAQLFDHTPRPIREPSRRSIAFITGVPDAGRAIHGAASNSMNESATSLRSLPPEPTTEETKTIKGTGDGFV